MKKLISLTFILALLPVSQLLAEAKREITVFYPSPYGEYVELRTERMAIGPSTMDASNLNYSSGQWTGIYTNDTGTVLTVSGSVGIGTGSARAKLDVVGGALIGFNEGDSFYLPPNGLSSKGSVIVGCHTSSVFPGAVVSNNAIGTCTNGSFHVAIGTDNNHDWGLGIFQSGSMTLKGWFSYNDVLNAITVAGENTGVIIIGNAPVSDPLSSPVNTPNLVLSAENGSGYFWAKQAVALITETGSNFILGKNFWTAASLDGEIELRAPSGGIRIANSATSSFIFISTDSHPNQISINQGPNFIKLEDNQITIKGGNIFQVVDTRNISFPNATSFQAPQANARFKTIYAPGSDYAEYFRKNPNQRLQPGDVVQIDPETGLAEPYDGSGIYLGIVSSEPIVVGNYEEKREKSPDFVLVSLVGQVDFNPKQTVVENRIVYTKDKKYRIGILLANGKVLLR